jgi:hypothetical protein
MKVDLQVEQNRGNSIDERGTCCRAAFIEEARQRRRRRRVRVAWVLLAVFVTLLLVIVVVGGGGTAPHGGAGPTSPSSRTATTALQRCAPSALAVAVSSGGGGGHIAYRLELRNVGARSCSLTGYPVVTAPLFWAGGKGLPTNARVIGQMIGYAGGIYGLTKRLKVYEHHLPVVALKSHGGVASVVVEYGDLIWRSFPMFTKVTLMLPHANPKDGLVVTHGRNTLYSRASCAPDRSGRDWLSRRSMRRG